MKKLTLSLAAIVAMGSVAMAETFDAYGSGSYENSAAPKPEADYTLPAPYIGIGYTYLSGDITVSGVSGGQAFSVNGDIDANMAVTLNAGFDFNQYIAAEVRYMSTINDTSLEAAGQKIYTNKKVRNIGAYLKPQYKNGTGTLYALLGYGKVEFADLDENQFQWGIGFSFDFENSMSMYFDFMRLYDEAGSYVDVANLISADMTVDTYTVGISYRF